jgi:hypothetical protein
MKAIIAAVLLTATITPALAQLDTLKVPPLSQEDRTIDFPPNPLFDTPQKPELPQPPDLFGVQSGSTERDRLLKRMREVRDAYRKEYGKRDPVGEITECVEYAKITTCYTHPF